MQGIFLKDNHKNEYIAATIILIYKKSAYYWWGCSKNEKDIGINKYLLFKSICAVRESFGRTGYFETGMHILIYEAENIKG